MLAFEDLRSAARATAIAACRRAGMRVAMITGDHPATARWRSPSEVGLAIGGAPVLMGSSSPMTSRFWAPSWIATAWSSLRVTRTQAHIAAALRLLTTWWQ